MNEADTNRHRHTMSVLGLCLIVLPFCSSSILRSNSAYATETVFSSFQDEDNKICSFLISEDTNRYLEVVAFAEDTLNFRLYAEEPEGWWLTNPSAGRTITLSLVFSDGSTFRKVGDIEEYSQRPIFELTTDVFRRIARSTELTVRLDDKEVLKATELNSLPDAQLLLNCATSLILSVQPNMQ